MLPCHGRDHGFDSRRGRYDHLSMSKHPEQSPDLISVYSPEDHEKATQVLSDLIKHLKSGEFVIVGGMAIRLSMALAHVPYPQRPFHDLDVVGKNYGVLLPSVIDDFDIEANYPPENPEVQRFWVGLTHKKTTTPEKPGVHVDFFDPQMFPEETFDVHFGQEVLKVQSAEDQFVKTVFDVCRISKETKVAHKQFDDAELLLQIVNKKKADEIWHKKREQVGFTHYPETIFKALELAKQIRKDHPDWSVEDPFNLPKD